MTEQEFCERYREKAIELSQVIIGMISTEKAELHLALYALTLANCMLVHICLHSDTFKDKVIEHEKKMMDEIATDLWRRKKES